LKLRKAQAHAKSELMMLVQRRLILRRVSDALNLDVGFNPRRERKIFPVASATIE
jgi:hypothetical protein